VAAFLAARLTAWPPHEDEVLALHVGAGSLSSLVGTVFGERGGAPLHFVLAWVVAHAGGGLTGLRIVSALFAVAAVPLVAAIASRLGGRTAGALAASFAATSWLLLFHGVYARMYSLFLVTSALSYLALLAALRDGGRRRWLLWVLAALALVATHPYGALVLGSQAVYVLLTRERIREALPAFGAIVVLGTPFWISDLVLAGRFDVGVGARGERLGPVDVFRYLAETVGDATGGSVLVPAVLVLAAGGAVALRRGNPRGARLVAAVFAVPTLALLVTRLGGTASPESRHLVFALPFFTALLAIAVVEAVRARPAARPAAVVLGAILIGSAAAWTWDRTPTLFTGESSERTQARDAASAYLAATGRPDDVLLGFDPVFLGAWGRDGTFSRFVLPRADAKLAAEKLREAVGPLGRGVWVLDTDEAREPEDWLPSPVAAPKPVDGFEVRAFGPFVVVRTVEPTVTADGYLRRAAAALAFGRNLMLYDADLNFATIDAAAERLGYERSGVNRSRSTSSR
jgi:hypothetical protein